MLRWAIVATLVPFAMWLGTPPAYATVSSANASTIANAIKATGTVVTAASWEAVPASGTPNGISDAALGGFPTNGLPFAILTTGDVNFADLAPPSTHTGTGANIGGGNVRGDTDYDVSILKIDFTVGEAMNCIRFDFRFFSEEYPEAVQTGYNDAFIAELDSSNWTTSASDINAPNNFAFDPNGDPITVKATGNTSMSPGPADTTYDGATPILTAAHQVTPGAHSLYLSIFDQGDHIFDSAVFVDNLVVGHAPNPDEQCVKGAEPKTFELTLTPHSATNPVGSPHAVTATVTEVTPSLQGPEGQVLFTVTGANSDDGAAALNSGQATFSYTGTNAGTDVITGCYDADSSDTCDQGEPFATVSKTWTAVAPPTSPPGTPPGAGGLPITGRATGLVAGAGVLVLALGTVGYLVIRRRRVRFAAE